MIKPAAQLDRRFDALRPLAQKAARPAQGWIRALRTALGMTTGQFAKRMKVTQPRVSELEKAEVHGNISLHSLERAAEALGCRVVYLLLPDAPLQETLQHRADALARERLAAVEQTMRLENQEVRGSQAAAIRRIAGELLERPARLWDDG